METREADFVRPVAPHRLKAYTALFTVVGIVFVGTTIGVGTGLLSPRFTLDVAANLLFGLPVIALPIVLFWKAPGEQRSRLQLAAELTLPLTVGKSPARRFQSQTPQQLRSFGQASSLITLAPS
ncbi:hypothetical protein [Mycolicibacterium sp. P1-5]|uniref:hypothetical protein n=1 Tax=Mycolicibacterium sp. P1-5 TaxID=2024617 RepID=UPI0011EC2031|nr:hypothetical protein [Mycolicibacterium sp. P1-5]KAA0108188.1 hypothetical protein CIW47_16120 [Mycolicibacterium sp. P1-5]